MNAAVRPADLASAVEEPRHRFTWDDVLAMMQAGIVEDGAREELIDGELVEMPADGDRHIDYTVGLSRWLIRALDDAYVVVPGSTLVLSPHNAPSPDFQVRPAAVPTKEVRGPNVLLAIEQSESSVRRDLGWKARLYARYGVRDYWAIELATGRVHVHRDPRPEGFGSVQVFGPEDRVEALLIPGLALRVSELPLPRG